MSALEYTQSHDVYLELRKYRASQAKSYATLIGKIQYRESFFYKK